MCLANYLRLNESFPWVVFVIQCIQLYLFFSMIYCFAKVERGCNNDLDTGKGNVLAIFILQH